MQQAEVGAWSAAGFEAGRRDQRLEMVKPAAAGNGEAGVEELVPGGHLP